MDNEKNLEKIEKQMMNELLNEEKIDNEIREKSEAVAASLILNQSTKLDLNGTQYLVKYKIYGHQTRKDIHLVFTDILKFKILGPGYKRPYIVQAEANEQYSLKDNLKTMVEGFIRHVTGKIKPEFLEE